VERGFIVAGKKNNAAGPTLYDLLAWVQVVERKYDCSVQLYCAPRTGSRGYVECICSVVVSFGDLGVLERWAIYREQPAVRNGTGAIEAAWIRCMISVDTALEYSNQAKFWLRP
jgi:hypothetical protein